MQSLMGVGIFVIVIDALDECDNRGSILQVLCEQKQIPENMRFIITTRPEGDIMRKLKGCSHVFPCDVQDRQAEMMLDIKRYVTHRLTGVEGFKHVDVEQLAIKAAGLFQWAATACNYITEDKAGADPRNRFNSVIELDHGLDHLYTAILKDRISSVPNEAKAVMAILARVMAAAEPLSVEILKALCLTVEEQQQVDRTIPLLGAVLSVYGVGGIRPLHTSFRDYLIDKKRSLSFFVDLDQGHQDLAKATFEVMKKELHFNICQIKSSYFLNSSLTSEQLALISPVLFYSCQFWAYHLQLQKDTGGFEDRVCYFMKNQLLFWIEVLSARKAYNVAGSAIESLQEVWKQVVLYMIILY